MSQAILITCSGEALRVDGGQLRSTIFENRDQAVLRMDFERALLLNAPPEVTLHRVRPTVFVLADAQGNVIFHPPEGRQDSTQENTSWSELTCLSLTRFPHIAGADTAFSPIPRRLHFICDNKTDIDPQFVANIERTSQNNPGWTVYIWDESARFQFISDHYGWEVLKIYLMLSNHYGAAKADFFRYLVIYALGGAYFDLKSTASKPLDAILCPDDQYLLSQWNMSGSDRYAGWGIGTSIAHVPGGEYQQWFLIARPRHPYLHRVIHAVMTKILTYRPEKHGLGAITTFTITGPHAYTKAIHPIRHSFSHRFFDSEAEGLVYSVVENHRALSRNNYREATTPLVIGNQSHWL